jgi:peptidoglycan/xylan/chitin deacetylase (PgdA/CDA1 family)
MVIAMRRLKAAAAPTAVLIAGTLAGGTSANAARAAVYAPADDVPTYTTALAARPDGGADAVYRAATGNVVTRTFAEGAWSAPANLGGRLIGAPAATYAGSALHIYGRGTDGQLWRRVRTDGTWAAWAKVGGLVMSSAPAAVGRADGRVDVFSRDASDRLYTRTYRPAAGWGAWTSLAGYLYSAPSAVIASGVLHVFTVGTDSAVWTRSLSGSTWSSWTSIGGQTYSAPAAATDPSAGRPMAFIRDAASNDLHVNTYNGTWSGWQPAIGSTDELVDGPTAVTVGTAVNIAARRRDTALWSRTLRAGTWSPWTQAWAPGNPPAIPAALLGKNITKLPTTSKVVALTFDGAWSSAGVASIRATLQRNNAVASFFLVGDFARLFPVHANLLATSGYRIGNHSDDHPDFTTIDDATARAEVTNARTAIFNANGAEPRSLFRFPYGAYNASKVTLLNGLGYVPVGWTVDSLGWKGTSGGMTTAKVASRVLAAATPGQIVLMHLGANPDDGTTLDAAALPQIITGLRDRGYSFVTLDALFPN